MAPIAPFCYIQLGNTGYTNLCVKIPLHILNSKINVGATKQFLMRNFKVAQEPIFLYLGK